MRPALPEVSAAGWPRGAVDVFILEGLDREGLRPSPEADRATLLRRAFLDLTGLAPTPADLDAFEADREPEALEKLIDRLLASPRFGEKFAYHWLDLARYADSNGYQRDGPRQIWPWRDWVVRAFNEDKPFDEFTVEQIAGDLLPDADIDTRIATGFHRNTTLNVEAGTDIEEQRVLAVFDRVDTTASVWLGSTLACARCHDHKYDPVRTEEYYGLFAFFNQTRVEVEKGKGAGRDLAGPWVDLPRQAADVDRESRLESEIAALERQHTELKDEGAATLEHRRQLKVELEGLRAQLERVRPVRSLVLERCDSPRTTHVFRRGDFLDPRDAVSPGTPAVLHPLETSTGEADRLDLAHWMVADENPLFARVAVNRLWAEVFGRGLVTTPEDFGLRGARPSHPELLDFLAVEFREGGYSTKSFLRRLLRSATWRQSAAADAETRARDPENRFLARGSRYRLRAELIRDSYLGIAGLLSEELGGRPVFPVQPDGVWNIVGRVDNTWRTSGGADRHRRGLYVYWRRSSPYPSFVNFDAPSREFCVVERSRSNTPLQALTLLNDEVYVHIARCLSLRVLQGVAAGAQVSAAEAVIEPAIRLVLSRGPRPRERVALLALWREARRRHAAGSALRKHYAADGLGTEGIDDGRLGAAFELATVLLNLDEAISRE